MIQVKMFPADAKVLEGASGIAQVIINWRRYLPHYGIGLVDDVEKADVTIGHAAAYPKADIHVSHGMLWTEEFNLSDYAHRINADLLQAALYAKAIIVPSEWVANVYRRDLRISPHVIRHGVNWEEWQHEEENEGYVLWSKNRVTDGLNPTALEAIAAAFPDIPFKATFGDGTVPNIEVLNGPLPFAEMKKLVQRAAVLVMTDRETWGIAAAEAMAAGVPVLTTKLGAVSTFMTHGIAGYCYNHTSLDDAIQGLTFCLQHRDKLGANGRYLATELDWNSSVAEVAEVIKQVYECKQQRERTTVDVIIPCHNYGNVVSRAVHSALNQTFPINKVIVVDDDSTDHTEDVVKKLNKHDSRVGYLYANNRNVALTRNAGIYASKAEYVVCLDADDWIEPDYVMNMITHMSADPRIGFCYTGIRTIHDTENFVPAKPFEAREGEINRDREWPTPFLNEQFNGSNQVPTTTLMRREALLQAGGYRARYAPGGAGTEDANLYLRLLYHGWKGKLVPAKREALFVHTHGAGYVSAKQGYSETGDKPMWTAWSPATKDKRYPFCAAIEPENKIAHPVRSYEPMVSVIIPVGPGHVDNLVNALDSLEAQTYRNWEAVVVFDTELTGQQRQYLEKAYPYASYVDLYRPHAGPGHARNVGVQVAKADYITFLDADDYLGPEFLHTVNWKYVYQKGAVTYSQYFTRMLKEDQPIQGGRVVKDEGNTVIVDYAFRPFDRDRAMQRPNGDRPYVWSGINILLHKSWHHVIGGFDETMETWEDCLYLLKLAWEGYDFHLIAQPLWLYNFRPESRREISKGRERELMLYIQEQYDHKFGGVGA